MLSWGLPRCEGVLLGVPGVPQSKTEGREHSGLPVNVVFSTPELCLREGGKKSWLERRSLTGCVGRSSKLPGKTLFSYYVAAAQLIAISLARSYLISKASC